jgi:septal ring factor EnvC (AmiA/AmiB activator)
MTGIVKLHENKIEQLKGEIKKSNEIIAQLNQTVASSREQIKAHELHIAKLSGAIEAFQSTLNVISPHLQGENATESPAVEAASEVVEENPDVENGGI